MNDRKFLNAKVMNKKYPDTFDIPTDEELDKVVCGTYVKICCYNERFWTLVKKVEKNGYIVMVSNSPMMSNLEYGDIIRIQRKHVLTILE